MTFVFERWNNGTVENTWAVGIATPMPSLGVLITG